MSIDLIKTIKLEADGHQTVYEDDRRRKKLFYTCANKITELESELEQANYWKNQYLEARDNALEIVKELEEENFKLRSYNKEQRKTISSSHDCNRSCRKHIKELEDELKLKNTIIEIARDNQPTSNQPEFIGLIEYAEDKAAKAKGQ